MDHKVKRKRPKSPNPRKRNPSPLSREQSEVERLLQGLKGSHTSEEIQETLLTLAKLVRDAPEGAKILHGRGGATMEDTMIHVVNTLMDDMAKTALAGGVLNPLLEVIAGETSEENASRYARSLGQPLPDEVRARFPSPAPGRSRSRSPSRKLDRKRKGPWEPDSYSSSDESEDENSNAANGSKQPVLGGRRAAHMAAAAGDMEEGGDEKAVVEDSDAHDEPVMDGSGSTPSTIVTSSAGEISAAIREPIPEATSTQDTSPPDVGNAAVQPSAAALASDSGAESTMISTDPVVGQQDWTPAASAVKDQLKAACLRAGELFAAQHYDAAPIDYTEAYTGLDALTQEASEPKEEPDNTDDAVAAAVAEEDAYAVGHPNGVKESGVTFNDKGDRSVTLRLSHGPALYRSVAALGRTLRLPARYQAFGPVWAYGGLETVDSSPDLKLIVDDAAWAFDIIGVPAGPECTAEAEVISAQLTALKLAGVSEGSWRVSIAAPGEPPSAEDVQAVMGLMKALKENYGVPEVAVHLRDDVVAVSESGRGPWTGLWWEISIDAAAWSGVVGWGGRWDKTLPDPRVKTATAPAVGGVLRARPLVSALVALKKLDLSVDGDTAVAANDVDDFVYPSSHTVEDRSAAVATANALRAAGRRVELTLLMEDTELDAALNRFDQAGATPRIVRVCENHWVEDPRAVTVVDMEEGSMSEVTLEDLVKG